MKRFFLKTVLTLFVCTLAAGGAAAQAINDIRINEIQMLNENGYEDDYGHRVGWIELFNTGYSGVDVGGAMLKVRGKEYRIPKSDPRTLIAPQGYLIFFAEGTAAKGTFHTNFTMDETDYVVFADQSGNLIDSLHYDHGAMLMDVSYGWFNDEDGTERLTNLPVTTPMATNDTLEKVHKSELFRQADPFGVVMAVIAVTVVFVALILLYLIFRTMGKQFTRMGQQREAAAASAKAATHKDVTVKAVKGALQGEALAAIAVALYKYSEDLHDIEDTVLTINRAAKAYSPWSSKIYGLRQLPNKK